MRTLRMLIWTAALCAIAAPALAASRGDWDACKGDNPDQSIAACTRIIQDRGETAKNSAIARRYRGLAYQRKDDLDRAIADYSEAIRLDPKYAEAYYGRGLTYRNKDDVERADYSEAIRLEPQVAAAYFNRGKLFHLQGNSGRALADFDEAIRLDPKFVFAYTNRGYVYLARGNNHRAIADFSEAIRLEPKLVSTYIDRGNAYRARGDNDRAIADFGEAIRLAPKFADAYYNRGLAYLYGGTLDKALADVSEASNLDPADAYKALWADIVAQRNNAPSHLSQASAKIDMTPWPAPIIRSYLGRMPPEAVLAAADDPDAKKKKSQVCEANFYGGELALRQGAKDEAVRLFQLAASGCARDANEWFAANAELKALGAAP